MKVREPLENLLHVQFIRQSDLAATFLRFQEFYESPQYKGKVFTFEEFKEWYTAHNEEGKITGRFNYFYFWSAFNIPSATLKPFYEGKLDPLSGRERTFLKTFADRKKPFYIIGTFGKDNDEKLIKDDGESLLKHEVSHGLFYLHPDYKKTALAIIDEIPIEVRHQIIDYFKRTGGYHTNVMKDEIHAHVLTEQEYLAENGVDISGLEDVRKKLEKNFQQWAKKARK